MGGNQEVTISHDTSKWYVFIHMLGKQMELLRCIMSLLMFPVKQELLKHLTPVVCLGPNTIHCFVNCSDYKEHLKNF